MSSFFDLSRAKYNPVAASEFVRPEKGNARHENLEKSTRASALSRLRKNSSIPSFDFEFPIRFPPNFYYTPSLSSRERSKIERGFLVNTSNRKHSTTIFHFSSLDDL